MTTSSQKTLRFGRILVNERGMLGVGEVIVYTYLQTLMIRRRTADNSLHQGHLGMVKPKFAKALSQFKQRWSLKHHL
jgi:hypothetical protein